MFDFASPTTTPFLHGYSDSSHADCPDTARSTLSYVFYYHTSILSWYSKLNSHVTTCTNHSEYAALFQAAKEAQWLAYLFTELACEPTSSIPIYLDNAGV